MMILLSFLNALVFIAIAGIHFYWAFGGRWGFQGALPEIEGKKAFMPSRLMTAAVAFVFLGVAVLYLQKGMCLSISLPEIIGNYGLKVLAIIMIARSVGDFRYVGFFKTIKNTPFADLDSKFYAPLCLYLGLSTLWLIYG